MWERSLEPVTLALCLFPASIVYSQPVRSITASRFESAPVIDGDPSDTVWQATEASAGFVQFEPQNGAPSTVETAIRIGYDELALYVLVICLDPEPERISAAVTQRDGEVGDDDAVGVFLDTFNGNSNGYFFITKLLTRLSDCKKWWS